MAERLTITRVGHRGDGIAETPGGAVYVPYVSRSLTADEGAGLERSQHSDIGDVRLTGIYTGLSADMSTGLEFGLKLPTGGHEHAGFDRDSDIGSGSTDLLLGAYQRGRFGKTPYSWFGHLALAQPVLTKDSYNPGSEVNAALGATHDAVALGGQVKVAPVFQLRATHRWHDGWAEGEADETGYDRLLAAPGLEFSLGKTKLYTDVSLPVYQHVTGEQLVAAVYFKLVVSRAF